MVTIIEPNNTEMSSVEDIELPPNFVRNMKRKQSIYVTANIDGFHEVCTFHQICGLPYYDMKPAFNIFRSILGFGFSLLFITVFVGKSFTIYKRPK